jgi:hypothetical protein
MQFPLISLELIADLRLGHGLFNLTVMLLFCYQARNGLLIRWARQAQAPPPLLAIKRHRRLGPLLALLGVAGFAAGLILAILHAGMVLLYPLHFSVGVAILFALFLTYRVSRTIVGPDDLPRNRHFQLGIALLALYLVNVVIGVGVLL